VCGVMLTFHDFIIGMEQFGAICIDEPIKHALTASAGVAFLELPIISSCPQVQLMMFWIGS